MKPHKKMEKKLRAVLSNTFGQGASVHWNNEAGDEKMVGEEIHPYVSFKIAVCRERISNVLSIPISSPQFI